MHARWNGGNRSRRVFRATRYGPINRSYSNVFTAEIQGKSFLGMQQRYDTSVVSSHCTYAKNPKEYRRVNAMKSQQVKKRKKVSNEEKAVSSMYGSTLYTSERRTWVPLCVWPCERFWDNASTRVECDVFPSRADYTHGRMKCGSWKVEPAPSSSGSRSRAPSLHSHSLHT